MVNGTAGLAPQSVFSLHHLEGQKDESGLRRSLQERHGVQKANQGEANELTGYYVHGVACGLPCAAASPRVGAQVRTAQLKQTSRHEDPLALASEARVTGASAPIPAVCTCRDSSSHKTNRAAKHTAEHALPGRWNIMGGAGHGGLPEWQGLQA